MVYLKKELLSRLCILTRLYYALLKTSLRPVLNLYTSIVKLTLWREAHVGSNSYAQLLLIVEDLLWWKPCLPVEKVVELNILILG